MEGEAEQQQQQAAPAPAQIRQDQPNMIIVSRNLPIDRKLTNASQKGSFLCDVGTVSVFLFPKMPPPKELDVYSPHRHTIS